MFDYIPVFTFIKAPFYEQMPFNCIIIFVTILLFIIGLIVKPTGITAFVSKKNKTLGIARWSGYTGTALILSYVALIVHGTIAFSGDIIFTVATPPFFASLYVSMLLIALMIPLAVFAWIKSYWSIVSRIFYTLVTLDGIAFVWFAIYWKIIF